MECKHQRVVIDIAGMPPRRACFFTVLTVCRPACYCAVLTATAPVFFRCINSAAPSQPHCHFKRSDSALRAIGLGLDSECRAGSGDTLKSLVGGDIFRAFRRAFSEQGIFRQMGAWKSRKATVVIFERVVKKPRRREGGGPETAPGSLGDRRRLGDRAPVWRAHCHITNQQRATRYCQN